MATKNGKRAKTMPRKSMKAVKGGAWYAKFDGVDGSLKAAEKTPAQGGESLPLEEVSFNYGKL